MPVARSSRHSRSRRAPPSSPTTAAPPGPTSPSPPSSSARPTPSPGSSRARRTRAQPRLCRRDLDIEGDVFAVFDLDRSAERPALTPRALADLLRAAGPSVLACRPPKRRPGSAAPSPPAGATARRSATTTTSPTISTSSAGPSMTYSCAVFEPRRSTWPRPRPPSTSWSAPSLGWAGASPARRRLRLGRDGGARGRHHGVRWSASPCPKPVRPRANGWPRRTGRAGGDPPAGLPRRRRQPSTRSPRSACSSTSGADAWPSTSSGCTPCCDRAADCSTTPSAGRARSRAAPSGPGRATRRRLARRRRAAARRGSPAPSWTATCSPTGSSTRWGPWSR